MLASVYVCIDAIVLLTMGTPPSLLQVTLQPDLPSIFLQCEEWMFYYGTPHTA